VYNAPWFRTQSRGNRHPDGKPGLLQIYQFRNKAKRAVEEAVKRTKRFSPAQGKSDPNKTGLITVQKPFSSQAYGSA
jgi:hypothetical protein